LSYSEQVLEDLFALRVERNALGSHPQAAAQAQEGGLLIARNCVGSFIGVTTQLPNAGERLRLGETRIAEEGVMGGDQHFAVLRVP
jgi:hypothetical protein